jgi:hypothetical protein
MVRARVILACLFVFLIVTESEAQSRIRRQTSRIFRGLANRIDRSTTESQTPVDSLNDTKDGLALERANEARDQHPEYSNHHGFSSGSKNELETIDDASRAVSIEDVIRMVQRGLGDKTIIQYVENNGVRKKLVVNEIIYLYEQGVSEPIIQAMQLARVFEVSKTPASRASRNRGDSLVPRQRPTDMELHGPSVLTAPQ